MADNAQLLLAYAKNGSDAAFAEIVRRHIDSVYSAARRRVGGDRSLAEEVVQSVFLTAARKAERLARHPQLSAWLYTATRHEAAHAVRAERRRRVREQEAHFMADVDREDQRVGDNALHQLQLGAPDWRRLGPAIDAAIDGLREEDRRMVLLRYFDRRPFAEVAMVLGVSEDAARMRVQRALEKMRSGLQKQGITSTAAALGVALTENAVMGAPTGLAGTVAAATIASAPVAASAGVLAGIGGVLLSPGAGILALLLAALGTAGFEFFAARAARGSLAAAQQAYAKATAGEQSDKRKLAAMAAPSVKAAASVTTGEGAIAAQDRNADGAAFLLRHPEVKDALKAYKYASMRSHYGSLWRSLGLSADQIEQFEQLMYPAGFSRTVQDGVIHFDEADQTPALTPKERGDALRSLLGSTGYQALLTFTHAQDAREATSNLAALMTGTDAPLTPGQAQQLSTILAASSPLATASDEAWGNVVAQAQGVLLGSQMEMLSSMRVRAMGLRRVQQTEGH